MDRELFASRFRSATERARVFARGFVIEELPERLCFHVVLNASFDGNPLHADERVYPDDSNIENQLALRRCSEHEVIELLWRDGTVPEWIDVSVVGLLVDATSIEVLCCGRFTANDSLLYHHREGMPPFHVLSPNLPNDHEEGKKFSVLHRAHCRTLEELAWLEAHASKPWSLELEGPSFDDAALDRLPKFRAMQVLDLVTVPLRGPGLAVLAPQPRLRALKIDLHARDTFSLEHVRRIRGLDFLSVKSRHPVVLADEWPGPLTTLWLSAPRLEGGCLPAGLKELHLHSADADPEELAALLDELTPLRLSLQGTRATDAIVESLVARSELRFLDVRDTAVTMDCLARIARRHPTIRILPEPLPDAPFPEIH